MTRGKLTIKSPEYQGKICGWTCYCDCERWCDHLAIAIVTIMDIVFVTDIHINAVIFYVRRCSYCTTFCSCYYYCQSVITYQYTTQIRPALTFFSITFLARTRLWMFTNKEVFPRVVGQSSGLTDFWSDVPLVCTLFSFQTESQLCPGRFPF